MDPNAMTLSISGKCHATLLDKIREFAILGKQHALKDFQVLSGHVNWSLAVFSLPKPSLSVLYVKILGKSEQMRPICMNTTICYTDACMGGMAIWYPEF